MRPSKSESDTERHMTMRDIIKKVPIPTAGVALALTALGNLLQPAYEGIHILCGALALFLITLLVAKTIMFPQMIREDLHNSILASVSGTAFMTFMQFSNYLAPVAFAPAFALWVAATVAHLVLIAWFTVRFFRSFKLQEVFPTYFICYVGIMLSSVTSPTFGMQAMGQVLFWFGFVCYAVLLVLVTYRYTKHEVPEPARPLFCIYGAPMSLSIVSYLAITNEPNALFVSVMMVLAQVLLLLVLFRLPSLLRLKFYPSYAAMTFPFVITATALGRGTAFFRAHGVALPFAFDVVFYAEATLATIMVAYVLAHYLRFFFAPAKQAQGVVARTENATVAPCPEGCEN